MTIVQRSAVAVLGLVAFAASGCHQSGPDDPVPQRREPWSFGDSAGRKIVTKHFDIYSTLLDTGLEDALPDYLEAAYRQYVDLLPPANPDASRLATYVFQSRSQWERFTRQNSPQRYPVYRRIGAGGYSGGRPCVVYNVRRPYPLSVLAHEGMQKYFANQFATRIPAWLNEGMATYCESFDLAGDRITFTPTRNSFRINNLRDSLRTGRIMPLRALLATDAGSVIAEGQSAKTGSYYAQAWALLCYLRHGSGGEYREGFARMLAGIRDGDLPTVAQAAKIRADQPADTSFGEAVFRAYITEDLDAFSEGFESYLYELAGFKRG